MSYLDDAATETETDEAANPQALTGRVEGTEENTPATPKDADLERQNVTKAPESYEQFSLPEGMDLDEGAIGEFLPMAKELDLTQAQAQKLVDLYSNKQMEAFQQFADAWQTTQSEWVEAARTDPEYGRGNFDANLKTANAFLHKYGTQELVDALQETGMGNHPELIRAFVKAGKDMAEDALKFGNEPQQPRSAADILFPNQGKE